MKWFKRILAACTLALAVAPAISWANIGKLLPASQAFVPQVEVDDSGVRVVLDVADGYYLYRERISAETTPSGVLGTPQFSRGEEKEDEFFGRQEVYHHNAEVFLPFAKPTRAPFDLSLTYQGCAEAGVCYPPEETVFRIDGNGLYSPPATNDGFASSFISGGPASHGSSAADVASDTAASTNANASAHAGSASSANSVGSPNSQSSRFSLSWGTLGANLLAFFVAGLGLSLTACMYPLLPIVSGIIVGDKKGGKKRGFILSMVYVQGLALTYTLVGVIAGLTGALLTVWLQQPWVVLVAAAIMVVLALGMFGVYSIQLPSAVQNYFQSKSSNLSGGKILSVFVMGMFSALIVGPCVAPPLGFALAYIGHTGDAVLGGLSLYVMALGTGVPLVLIGTFGGHILPRAGAWMNGIKYAFGFILLAVAVYLASPYFPYAVNVAAYTLLLVVPSLMIFWNFKHLCGKVRSIGGILAVLLLLLGAYFAVQSGRGQSTVIHDALTLHEPGSKHFGKVFKDDVAGFKAAIHQAFADKPNEPVLVDFYADWCISCKEMAAYTFTDPAVQAALDEHRFFQIDVTANTPENRAILREYDLYGPPGLFMLHANGARSTPILGYVKPPELLAWYNENKVR